MRKKILKKVAKKTKVNYEFCNNVVSSFIDLFNDKIYRGEEINIINFGKFYSIASTPRKYYNIHLRRMSISRGNKLLKFKLDNKLKKLIISNIDIVKTFL